MRNHTINYIAKIPYNKCNSGQMYIYNYYMQYMHIHNIKCAYVIIKLFISIINVLYKSRKPPNKTSNTRREKLPFDTVGQGCQTHNLLLSQAALWLIQPSEYNVLTLRLSGHSGRVGRKIVRSGTLLCLLVIQNTLIVSPA